MNIEEMGYIEPTIDSMYRYRVIGRCGTAIHNTNSLPDAEKYLEKCQKDWAKCPYNTLPRNLLEQPMAISEITVTVLKTGLQEIDLVGLGKFIPADLYEDQRLKHNQASVAWREAFDNMHRRAMKAEKEAAKLRLLNPEASGTDRLTSDALAVYAFALSMCNKLEECKANGRSGWDDPSLPDQVLCQMLLSPVGKDRLRGVCGHS